jgi:23S rRNA (cytosine1962-C5)-methyltransferase
LSALEDLPRPSARRVALHVTPAAERALRSGHPWVFDQAIVKQSHAGRPGDLAAIFDAQHRFLAIGLYDPDSAIRVRILQHRQPAAIDDAWFAARLRTAAAIRAPLNVQHTNGYRLVNGENDHLPGLVVDRYAGTLVLKLYTVAWLPHLAPVVAALQAVQPFERLVLRFSRNLDALMASHGLRDGQILSGAADSGPVVFMENCLTFAADVVHGHKTGFFFDQRDNRAHVRALASGCRALDLFAYSGGFSVYAAAGGATSVTSVDVSAPALEAAAANWVLNRADPHVAAAAHHAIVADVFDYLAEAHDRHERFDLLIVDPPAFAKSASEVERALAAYARLTRLAVQILRSGGILVSASCSSRVTPAAFFDTITRSAQQAGRPLREIRRSGHALDHPIAFPEGAYLKCSFARAGD